MKTAMQELMENVDYLKTMGVTIHWEKYLEKEKEQIIEAFDAGFNEANSIYQNTFSLDYYNQTYNQNK